MLGFNTERGCLQRDLIRSRSITHGDTSGGRTTSEYQSYRSAKGRCRNSANKDYKHYGGRGIEFRFVNYAAFLNELGRKPAADYSVDRIDNNGHYEPGNVRWATQKEQAGNKRNSRK